MLMALMLAHGSLFKGLESVHADSTTLHSKTHDVLSLPLLGTGSYSVLRVRASFRVRAYYHSNAILVYHIL